MTHMQSMVLGPLLREARGRIDAVDAEWLLAHVMERPRSWLFAHDDASVSADLVVRFEQLVARRAAGEPVAYLTGRRGFWRFDLAVTADTLIPRPDTELLVETVLSKLAAAAPVRVADLGTGSGAIALAVALERPQCRLVATDRSEAALAIAQANANALGAGNLEFRAGDWLDPLKGEHFDIIASNPPYIAAGDAHLQQGDLRFEPRDALTPGGDGLDAIRTIAADAPSHLHAGGWLMLEHGHDQGPAVRALLRAAGFTGVETRQDLEARDRVTIGQRAPDRNG